MKQTAALYARVSTQHQEEEATIASQVAAIEEYATHEGYALRKDLYFLDEAVSGAKLDRPALDRLRDREGEGCYQVVICLSPDRLARVYMLQVLLLEEFRQAGIQMLFVNQPPVSDSPQSQLLFGIQGLFAEYERAVIAERMRRGRLHRARQGAIVNPQTPYGYDYVPKTGAEGGRWEINAEEARVVRQIYAWYTQSEPMTIQEITDRLNRDGFPPRSGKCWRSSVVGKILRQTQYTGLAYYNRTEKVYHEVGRLRKTGHGKRLCPVSMLRPAEEWIAIPVPSILDKDIWLMAEERLKTNQRFSIRNNRNHHYLLRGLLICATCGHTLTARAGDGYFSYSCGYGGVHRAPDTPEHTCCIDGNTVETVVWNAVVELLKNPKLISQAWGCNEAANIEQGEKERLENRLRVLDRQQERLLDLYQDEQLEKPSYLVRKQRLDEEQKNIQTRLLQFEQEAKSEQIKQELIEDFQQYCLRIQENLANPSPVLQQEVIRLLIDHVVVGKNEIVIKHIVPTDDDCRLKPQRLCVRNSSVVGGGAMHYIRTILILLVIYLALTGNLQASNIVLGALVAGAATLLLRPRGGQMDLRRLPAAAWAVVRYIAILAADVVKSGVTVARIVLDPALPIRPGIVAIDSGCDSEWGAALSAHAISITPGELVIGISQDGILYTHCLDATHSAEYAAEAQAMRRDLLSKIFA